MSIIRDLTIKIKAEIDNDEIILVVGPRQAGKTTVLHQIEDFIKEKNHVVHFLNLEDHEYLSLLKKSPKNLFKIFPFDLRQKTYVLVDEVQYLDDPTNFLKYFYDEYKGKIKIITTGSSAFYLDRRFKDSLVGRKKIFKLLTLSFKEFLRFKNEEDLIKQNLNKISLSEKKKINLYYREYLIYGGYPRVVLSNLSQKKEILEDLAYSYIKKDIFEANIKQEDIFYNLMRILASQIGNLVNSSEIASTLNVSRSTIEDYLSIMERSFHIKLIHPFYKNLRKEITKMPKVYFIDLGLRNFLLKNLNQFDLREDKGQILENILYRELLEKYDFSEIKFWRTIQKHEVDFIIGEEIAYEVKVNSGKFNKNRYKKFIETYPEIKFNVVTIDKLKEKIGDIPIINIWQLI
ncbi:MAG: ATP-binding protein [Candidatus Portnoybacteria bacterium]|nr:ATP-binding protein [Candidatus Portnoybacteria bacterium]